LFQYTVCRQRKGSGTKKYQFNSVNEITRLEERRRDHCINLVSDLSEEEHKLHHLLPPRKCLIITRNTRSNKDLFYNFNSRTNRFKFSPIPYAVDTFNSIVTMDDVLSSN
jgi:hypothetical protein